MLYATAWKRSQKDESLHEAFTRQHYEAIAAAIDDTLAIIEEQGGSHDAIRAVSGLARQLAVIFKNDNRLFDERRFLQACGV